MTKEIALPATVEDKKWQAESDCRTLMDAEEIKKDGKRYEAALSMAKEKQKELDALMANRPLSKNG